MQVVLRDNRFHVIDKDGQPVQGLSLEDFTFKIGRKRIELTHFEEVDLTQKVETNSNFSRQKNAIIVLDTGFMDKNAFLRIKEAVAEFIETSVQPDWNIKLVQLEQKMIHLSEFSSRKEVLLDGLSQVQHKGTFRAFLRMLDSEVLRSYQQFIRQKSSSILPSSFEGADQANLSFLADQVLEAIREKEVAKFNHFLTYFYNLKLLGEILAPMSGDRAIYLFSGGQFLERRGTVFNSYQQFDKLAHQLNHKGITIHSYVHQTKHGLNNQNGAANEFGIFDSTQAFVEVNSAASFSNLTKMEIRTLGSNNGLVENMQQPLTGPRASSSETGGIFKHTSGTRDLKTSIAEFMSNSQKYYRFTYRIEEENSKDKLVIKFSNKDMKKAYKILYGKKFKLSKPYSKWDEVDRRLAFEQTIRFKQVFQDDLNIEVSANVFRSHDESLIIPVFIGLSYDHSPKKGFEVGMATFNGDHVTDVTYDTVILKEKQTTPLLYQVLHSRELFTQLRVYVRNMDSGRFSYQQVSLEPRNLNEALSGLSLGQDHKYQLIPIHHVAQNQITDMQKDRINKDPYFVRQKFFIPALHAQFFAMDIIPFFVHVTDLEAPLDQYEIGFYLQKEDQKFQILGSVLDAVRMQDGCYKLAGKIHIPDFVPGKTQLILEMSKLGEERLLSKISRPLTIL